MIKRDLKTDVVNLMYKNKDEISSLIPYQYEGVHYALDLDADPLLRDYFVSAIIAYLERNNDVAFEDILTSENLSDLSGKNSYDKDERVRYMIVNHAYTISQIAKNYYNWNFSDKDGNDARCLFIVSMERLYASFSAAVSLLNSGFFVEVIPVFRLILEQIAWGCYLLQETESDKILKNHVQKDIDYLKAVLKDDRYGKLYGYLSSEAHLEPTEIAKYLRINEEEKSITIRKRSGKECEKETGNLLLLLQAYGEVVWVGMEHFEFPEVEKKYFEDWYQIHKLLVKSLWSDINEKNS